MKSILVFLIALATITINGRTEKKEEDKASIQKNDPKDLLYDTWIEVKYDKGENFLLYDPINFGNKPGDTGDFNSIPESELAEMAKKFDKGQTVKIADYEYTLIRDLSFIDELEEYSMEWSSITEVFLEQDINIKHPANILVRVDFGTFAEENRMKVYVAYQELPGAWFKLDNSSPIYYNFD